MFSGEGLPSEGERGERNFIQGVREREVFSGEGIPREWEKGERDIFQGD